MYHFVIMRAVKEKAVIQLKSILQKLCIQLVDKPFGSSQCNATQLVLP